MEIYVGRDLSRDPVLFSSLSACALSLALGLWLDPGSAKASSSVANQALIDIGVPSFTLIAGLLAGLGYLTRRRRADAAELYEKRTQDLKSRFDCTETGELVFAATAREPARTLFRW